MFGCARSARSMAGGDPPELDLINVQSSEGNTHGDEVGLE